MRYHILAARQQGVSTRAGVLAGAAVGMHILIRLQLCCSSVARLQLCCSWRRLLACTYSYACVLYAPHTRCALSGYLREIAWWRPRLFGCKAAAQSLRVREVFDFVQADLRHHKAMLLDNYNQVRLVCSAVSGLVSSVVCGTTWSHEVK